MSNSREEEKIRLLNVFPRDFKGKTETERLTWMFWSARFSVWVPPWILNSGVLPVVTANKVRIAVTTASIFRSV
jgi:hypothetical protein